MIPRTPTTARGSIHGQHQLITPKITTSPKNINAMHRDLLSPNKKSQQYLNQLRMQMKQLDEVIQYKKEEISHEYKSLLDEQIALKRKIDLEYLEMYEEEDNKFITPKKNKKQKKSRKGLKQDNESIWDSPVNEADDLPLLLEGHRISRKKRKHHKLAQNRKSKIKEDFDIEEEVDECSPFESDHENNNANNSIINEEENIVSGRSTPIREDDEIKEILRQNNEESVANSVRTSIANLNQFSSIQTIQANNIKSKVSPIKNSRRKSNFDLSHNVNTNSVIKDYVSRASYEKETFFDDLGKGSPQKSNYGRHNLERYDPDASRKQNEKLRKQQELQKELEIQIRFKQEKLKREEEERRKKEEQDRIREEREFREKEERYKEEIRKQKARLSISGELNTDGKQNVVRSSVSPPLKESIKSSPNDALNTTYDNIPAGPYIAHSKKHRHSVSPFRNSRSPQLNKMNNLNEHSPNQKLYSPSYDDEVEIGNNLPSARNLTRSPIQIPSRKVTMSPSIPSRNGLATISKPRSDLIQSRKRQSDSSIHIFNPPSSTPEFIQENLISRKPPRSNNPFKNQNDTIPTTNTFEKLPPLLKQSENNLRRSFEDSSRNAMYSFAPKRHSVANPTDVPQSWDELFELKQEISNEQDALREKISGLLNGLKTRPPTLLSRESQMTSQRVQESRQKDNNEIESTLESRKKYSKENGKKVDNRLNVLRGMKNSNIGWIDKEENGRVGGSKSQASFVDNLLKRKSKLTSNQKQLPSLTLTNSNAKNNQNKLFTKNLKSIKDDKSKSTKNLYSKKEISSKLKLNNPRYYNLKIRNDNPSKSSIIQQQSLRANSEFVFASESDMFTGNVELQATEEFLMPE